MALGCSAPLATRPAEVTVQTADGTPVAGAVVRADPIDPHHPLNIADYFKGDPGTLGSWRSDESGRAMITLLRDRPTAVSFVAAGFLPDSMVIDSSTPPPLRLTLAPVTAEDRNPR